MKKAALCYRGFTLVEVLLAVMVGSLVVITALATYRNVYRTRRSLLERSELLAQGRFVLQQIRHDLANFYRDRAEGRMYLTGQKKQLEEKRADRIRFHTVSDQPCRGKQVSADVHEVEYSLVYRDEQQQFYLARRAAPLGQEDRASSRGILTYLTDDIEQLQFDYYYENQWQDYWNSQTVFPQLIRITLVLHNAESRQNPISLSHVVSLEPLARQSSLSILEKQVLPYEPIVPQIVQ